MLLLDLIFNNVLGWGSNVNDQRWTCLCFFWCLFFKLNLNCYLLKLFMTGVLLNLGEEIPFKNIGIFREECKQC